MRKLFWEPDAARTVWAMQRIQLAGSTSRRSACGNADPTLSRPHHPCAEPVRKAGKARKTNVSGQYSQRESGACGNAPIRGRYHGNMLIGNGFRCAGLRRRGS